MEQALRSILDRWSIYHGSTCYSIEWLWSLSVVSRDFWNIDRIRNLTIDAARRPISRYDKGNRRGTYVVSGRMCVHPILSPFAYVDWLPWPEFTSGWCRDALFMDYALLGLFAWARGDRQVESGRFPDAIVGYFPSIEPTQISPTCSDVQDLPGSLGIDTSSLVLTLLPLEYEQLCLDIYISHRLPFLPRHQYPTPLTH